VAPLTGLALWGSYRHTSLHARDQELSLRQSLGLRIKVAAVAHPRPGITRYDDVVLTDAETGRPVAICELVEARHTALHNSARLGVTNLTVRRGGLPACYAVLERLIQHVNKDDLNLALSIDGITIEDDQATTTISRASGTIRVGTVDSEARLVFETAAPTPADASAAPADGDKILLRVARHHAAAQPSDEWELHTGQLALPCSWMAAIVGPWPGLDQGHFHGSIWAKNASVGGTITVRGGLTDVNLATLLTEQFGHVLEGTVDIELLEPAHLQGGRLLDLHARIVGGPGRIGRSLLTAASGTLGCAATRDPREPGSLLNFEQLALEVAIDARGRMVIAGRCAETRGALLSDAEGRPLLGEPRQQPQPVVNLVRAVGGAETQTIPATPQAARLLSWLPAAAAPAAVNDVPATATRPAATVNDGASDGSGNRR